MWGMMNTLQIIYYFPILSHFFPIFVMQFLKYFWATKLDFNIPVKSEYQDWLFSLVEFPTYLNETVVDNIKYKLFDLENANILTNIHDSASCLL